MTETKLASTAAAAMEGIAKIDASGGIAAFSYAPDHPVMALWVQPVHGLLHRLQSALQATGADLSRTLVLLPYAQLRPLAARLWAQTFGDGFAPRFETTMNWCNSRDAYLPQASDIHLDVTVDLLTAQHLLAGAGLAAEQSTLAGLLVETAHQLAPLAAARAPWTRQQWAQEARQAAVLGMAGTAMQWEIALSRIAVEWAALSGYASDVLFEPARCGEVDCLVVVQGIASDPLTAELQSVWGQRLLRLHLQSPDPAAAIVGRVGLHACRDAEDEAQRCAATALAHIAQGNFPLALVSSDRVLTRRVRALLEGAGVAMRDENGWKQSTGQPAAQLMALLKACSWNASADQVLNWLKALAPEYLPDLDAIEAALRREQLSLWSAAAQLRRIQQRPELLAQVEKVDALRASAKGHQPLAQWLAWLRRALQACGLWDSFQASSAGVHMLGALRLTASADGVLTESLGGQVRFDLAAFTAWVNQTLEASSFKPDYPLQEQVVILPMSQMLGRPFAAVLLVGCDEVRLQSAPEPQGHWTAAQRLALGLPSRETLQAHVLAAWNSALQTPVREVFWRCSDETGEALLASPLVQLLRLSNTSAAPAPDCRLVRSVASTPTLRPLPTAQQLPVLSLNQGAYDDLRQCPYRFFALRQLGLQEAGELDAELDKRDFGIWLHAVLQCFHAELGPALPAQRDQRQTLLQQASESVTRSMGLAEGDFLPFAASWPALREGYLDWLQAYDQTTAGVFHSGETAHQQQFGTVTLHGRIDRIDKLPDGQLLVLDYKTENNAKTRARTKDPLEDTQMAFYAALLPDDSLRGGYINLAEKKVEFIEQTQLLQARDALVEGMLQDVLHIAQGAPLAPLGQGSACDFCQARGLCRKDHWSAP